MKIRIALVLIMASWWVVLAVQAHADSTAYINTDDNTMMMQEFVDTVAYVEGKYGTGPITVQTAWLQAGEFAEVSDRTGVMTVNKAWATGDYADLTHSVEADIADGFHNSGCDPIQTIALHESAHIIDMRNGFVARDRLMAATRDDYGLGLHGVLSGYSFDEYGFLNTGEALAEAFQAAECGSANAVELQIYHMLVG